MCEYTKISHKKCENHDQCHFGANINRDVCMKVMLAMDVYVYIICVLSIYSFNFIMRIADDVIDYVHDDVDVSAYEYVNVYADGYENDNDSCYCICI